MILIIYGVILLLIVAICIFKDRKKLPDTIKWFNSTYAIFTVTSGGNYNKIGGSTKSILKTLSNQSALKDWWGITTKDELENTLYWLLNGGHNSELLDEYFELNLENYTSTTNNYNTEEKIINQIIFEAYSRYGNKAILGWDLSRAMQIIASAYIAEYYTYEEAMDKSLSIAKLIQKSFNSWEELVNSYLLGHKYWFHSNFQTENVHYKNTPEYREKIYAQIKSFKISPYTIPWNLKLEKNW